MNIQGVCILSQQIVFSQAWYSIVTCVIMMCLTYYFAIIWLGEMEKWAGPIHWSCFALFIICMVLTCTKDEKTIFNYPSKIEYTIEIIDDNAWKELGPNYTVKEKPYETKEIYIIEGDYIDDNT